MRYLIKFTKEDTIKFISHLDLLRTIQRTIRRSSLKGEYSKGFNPHLNVSIAQPLSVGLCSRGEYMDIYLEEEVSEEEVKDELNKVAPIGIKILDIVKINDKKPNSMACIEACEYIIKIHYYDVSNLEKYLKELLNKEKWMTIKKSKKGEKEVDIKPMVKSFEYSIEEEYLSIKTLINSGSRENLSSKLLADYIKKNTKGSSENKFTYIQREEMYTKDNEELISLLKFFKK